MDYYQESLSLLKYEGINTNSNIEYNVNGVLHTLKIEDIITNYMKASSEGQEIFYETLKKALEENALKDFFEKMGELLLLSSYSDTFPSS